MIDFRGETAFGVLTANPGALTAAAEALLCADLTIPAGYMVAGKTLRCVLFGRASSATITPGTLTLRVRWGGLAGVILADSGALTQNVIVQTDKSWWWETFISCWTTTTFMTVGQLNRGSKAAAVVADITPDLVPPTAPVAVTVVTNIDKLLSFTAQPSLATASIQCHGRIVYPIN